MAHKEIFSDFCIDMVETSRGCPEACAHCGAYELFRSEDLRVQVVDVDSLREWIRRHVHLLNPQISTYVNTEPLRASNFIEFAQMVYEESDGASQVVDLLHGVRAGNRLMRDRFEAAVDLMRNRVIRLIALTVDSQRSKGRISYDQNYASYRESLEIMRPALALPYGRVTVSLQGEREDEGPHSIIQIRRIFEDVLDDIGYTSDEREKLAVYERSYVRVGRSMSENLYSEDCDVIPDPEFVRQYVRQDHAFRGMIDFDGRVLFQQNRPGKTYQDSVTKHLWQELLAA